MVGLVMVVVNIKMNLECFGCVGVVVRYIEMKKITSTIFIIKNVRRITKMENQTKRIELVLNKVFSDLELSFGRCNKCGKTIDNSNTDFCLECSQKPRYTGEDF